MRIQKTLPLAALVVVAIAVGCGPNEIEMGEGSSNPSSTPTPTPSGSATPTPAATPDPAGFTPIQSFLEIGGTPNRANCGNAGCHVAPTGQAGIVLYTAAGTAAADVAKNATTFSCSPNLDTYDPPAGLIYDNFCAANGNALAAPQHSGRTNLTNADCAALKSWLESGSGTPPNCP